MVTVIVRHPFSVIILLLLFQVKEWLCLNCQMQRTLSGPEPSGHPMVKPQPSPSKIVTPSGSEQKDMPAAAQKQKSTESSMVKRDDTVAPLQEKETPKAEAALSTEFQKADTRRVSADKTPILPSTERKQSQGVSGQPHPAGKSPQIQSSQTTKPEVKADLSKQEAGKLPQQPTKTATPAAKSVPPAAQPAKQESGGFFGFGGPKTQPTAAKPAESVTGKMFGFGSSIFSSASTLITSAVQDEPKTTPPTPRKMSTSSQISGKTTPPVSPKMSPPKETKPPAQKSEPPQSVKTTPAAQVTEKKTVPEPLKVSPKAKLSTCPLCKVELNMGSKEPPNYNTCTECKNTVCHLCGFNPMPHTEAVSAVADLIKCFLIIVILNPVIIIHDKHCNDLAVFA